ncbi:RHS repeat domain-containing protein [Viscerimonas tarda]
MPLCGKKKEGGIFAASPQREKKLPLTQRYNPNANLKRHYVGNKVYETVGSTLTLKKILFDNGYIENNIYYFYLRDHLGNNSVVVDANGVVRQRLYYYPYGKTIGNGESTSEGFQPYKFGGKEAEPMFGLGLYDFEARRLNDYGGFDTVDPHAESYYNWSPYAYCANNPIRNIDPTGMDEFDYIDNDWRKISEIGGNIGIDFYHMGIKNDAGFEITNVTDRNGNWIEMSDGRNILKGGEIRGNDVNWKTITNEFLDGTGPSKSIFEGNHPANEAIQEHYLYQEKLSEFNASGNSKAPYEVNWGITDIFKTGISNDQAQMMGSYNASFYKLGENTLNLVQDSKSKSSLYYHLTPTYQNYDRGKQYYNPWAGTWTTPPAPRTNTYQNHLFWTK